MKKFVNRLFSAAALAGALAIPTSAAFANTTVRAGTLECDVSGGIGLIFVEKQTMTCTFTSAKGKLLGAYTGQIKEVGVALGATAEGVLVWAVLAAQADMPAGALAGTYAGVTANASFGVGAGANVLIGGTGRSFILQPLSVEGQVGVNIAGGVTTVTLQAVP